MTLPYHTLYRSPNCDDRLPGTKIKFIIIHYTELNFEESLQALTDQNRSSPVSAHYLLSEEGETFQLVPDNLRAWHAGKSCWGPYEGLNTWSIGIELVNLGNHPFASAQILSLRILVKELQIKYTIPPKNILGHSEIAPGRKVDPGPHFPWHLFRNPEEDLHLSFQSN
jgi:N-acetylmuramoyl-L-alanine amidase